MFARPLPQNLITVACCNHCNNAHSKDEDLFRLIATLGVNQSAETVALYEQRTLPNTVGKNRLRREIEKLLSTREDRWLEINGVFAPYPTVRVPVPPLRRVATKIARGLVAHLHPELETHSLCFETYIPQGGQLLEAFAFLGEDLTELRIGGPAFHAYHGTCVDEPTAGVWLMIFHQRIPAVVFHFDGEPSRGEPHAVA